MMLTLEAGIVSVCLSIGVYVNFKAGLIRAVDKLHYNRIGLPSIYNIKLGLFDQAIYHYDLSSQPLTIIYY